MILVDAHVHIYDCFNLERFLNAAYSNFRAEADRLGIGDKFVPILLLAETAKENWFKRLLEYTSRELRIGVGTNINWTFHKTNEKCSIYAKLNSNQGLFIISGQQIITREGLEVLSLCTEKKYYDGEHLEKVIRAVRGIEGIPVIPWAVGKWIGQRGVLVKQILHKIETSGIFLGDNGNRPSFWPKPPHFRLGEKKNIKILPGSDPLPLSSESGKAGSFGFSLNRSISHEYPARDLKQLLTDPAVPFRSYGRLENPYHFFRNQLALRMRRTHNK